MCRSKPWQRSKTTKQRCVYWMNVRYFSRLSWFGKKRHKYWIVVSHKIHKVESIIDGYGYEIKLKGSLGVPQAQHTCHILWQSSVSGLMWSKLHETSWWMCFANTLDETNYRKIKTGPKLARQSQTVWRSVLVKTWNIWDQEMGGDPR